MSKKKTTQTSTQANTYGYAPPPPDTADITALRGMQAHADTSIPYNYAKQREALNSSYQNPIGSYTSPAVREALQRNAGHGLDMAEAQAQQNSQTDADSANYARQAALAQMTSPHFVQTGGASTGTQTQSGGFWGDLATTALQGAGGSLA